jgi:hypothetical protein
MPSQPDQPGGIKLVDEPRRYDATAVARVSTQAVPRSIRLSFIHADIDEREGAIPSDWSGHAIIGFDSGAEFDRDAKTLLVICGFLAMYVHDVEKKLDQLPTPREAPFELHTVFRLGYELRDVAGIEDSDPSEFAATNGVMHAWPYWREIAQSTSVRFGLAPLLVGTYKMPWSGDPKAPAEQSTDINDTER